MNNKKKKDQQVPAPKPPQPAPGGQVPITPGTPPKPAPTFPANEFIPMSRLPFKDTKKALPRIPPRTPDVNAPPEASSE